MADRNPPGRATRPVDPWAAAVPVAPSVPTKAGNGRPAAGNGWPGDPAYRLGVAPVGVPDPASTLADSTEGAGIPAYGKAGIPTRAPRTPLRYRMRQLRRGWEWTGIGALFAFVAWGIWAAAQPAGPIGPAVTFVLVLIVAAGVFLLSRLLGRIVLERWLGRIRRTAWPSHAITGVFLAAAGVQYLRQTQWVIDGLTWLRGLG